MSAKLAAALVKAQAAMPPVLPDKQNPHFRSMFVSLDHLIATTRGVLNDHGLAIVQSPSHIDGSPALSTTIYHESGESTTDVMPLILGGSDMQKLGAALTYARRYAWAAALGICADEDDDGNTASAPQGATKPAGTPNPVGTTASTAAAGTTHPAAAPPTNGAAQEFRFTSGKHEGKTLAEAGRSYCEWYVANGPKPDVREMCAIFLGFDGTIPDDSIPF